MNRFAIGVCALLLQSCATVSSISTSQIPEVSARQQQVTSSASNVIIFWIPFGNSFAERARQDIENQCPHGRIEGVLAKHQYTNYFLNFFSTQSVTMQGYCLSKNENGTN